MKKLLAAALLVLVAATSLAAQQRANPLALELRPFGGVLIPTGALADDFKTAAMAGGQVAFELSPVLHLMGTAAWTQGHNKFPDVTDDVTYVWQFDVGAEYTFLRVPMNTVMFRPFVGLGLGARTYDYKEADFDTKTCTAGYGALGTEFLRGDWALRAEARDYMTCYTNPVTNLKKTRNDVGIALGFAYHIHR